MKTIVILLLVLVCGSCSQAQSNKVGRWKVDGAPAGDAVDRRAVNGFGAHLLVIRNPKEFMEMWRKPEKPDFDSAQLVGFNELIGVIVLFAGCKPNDNGICNAEVDYSVYKPDGTPLIERKKQKLWKQEAPPSENTQLGEAVLGFTTATGLSTGKYKVTAKVSDLNADISFDLETQFELK